MYVDLITFSGADDSIDPAELLMHCVKLNAITFDLNIELAILLSAKNMGTPRYPSLEWIQKLAKYNSIAQINLAGHICGQWARNMVQGDFTFTQDFTYWEIFKRIQINLKGYTGAVNEEFFTKLQQYGKNKEYIIQIDGVHDWLLNECLKRKINAVPLFDKSGGEGKTPDEWPICKNGEIYSIGYAGGLGPENLFNELIRIENVNKDNKYINTMSIWVDMESKIRTDDKFDINKCISAYDSVRIYSISDD